MQTQQNVVDCYNLVAGNYAGKFGKELDHKHFDRLLLSAFAKENKDKGRVADLGCGPGQTTAFLFAEGISDITGSDISVEMINSARQLHPGIEFEQADMLNLSYPDDHFGSAIAFYSIVHFNPEQLKKAFQEISRVLANDGQFLFSFHIGSESLHLDNFLDKDVDINFYFFEPANIRGLLEKNGFSIIDMMEREPYSDHEYNSRRSYIWARTKKSG